MAYPESNYAVPRTSGEVQAVRQPQIAESFDVLERTVEAHEKLCAEIEQRLQPILRQEPEATEGGSQSEPKRTVVEMARRINNSSDRLHQLSNKWNSILRRLELP